MPSAKELRDIAKDLGIRGYSKMNKSQLTESIEGHVKSNKALAEKSVPKESSEPAQQPVKVESEPAPAPAPAKSKRTKSPWVSFCQEYSKEHGVTYKEAMSKKDEYNTWKSKKSESKVESAAQE